MPVETVALALAVILAAAVLRGFTGFGFALAAVPLLNLIVEPRIAVTVALLLQFGGGLLELPKAAGQCHWPSLRPLIAGGLVATPLGMLALTSISAAEARLAIAATTILALVLIALGGQRASFPRWPVSAGFGAVAGVFSGLAAMPGPPAVFYYLMVPLPPAAVRASLLVFFFATSVAGTLNALWFGLINREALILSIFGLGAMLLGSRLGGLLFVRVGDRSYRPVAIACLAAIAVASAIPAARDLI